LRTFLLISPYFAPQAALGAYRWVKIARHLPRLGWRPVVLSATFPEDPRDYSLLDALPPEVEIVEDYLARPLIALQRRSGGASGEPARQIEGLQPSRRLGDRCVIHAPHAALAAVRLARRAGAEAVVVSAGPFSAVPVGLRVQRALGLPLVLDFRDPWALHESGADRAALSRIQRARQDAAEALERRWVARADHLILNTCRALDVYRARYPEIASRSSFIRNCYDLDLVEPPDEVSRTGHDGSGRRPFVILHLGTLRKETTIDDIGAAMRRLIDTARLAPGEIVLRQIGRISAYERQRISELDLAPYVEVLPPVPQREVLAELRRAHVLLSMVTAQVTLRISAKLYDYVASGMPIVSITANPEVDELLAGRPDSARLEPGDVDGLTATLARHLARFRETGALPTPAPPPAEFSSSAAAERVAAILNSLR